MVGETQNLINLGELIVVPLLSVCISVSSITGLMLITSGGDL
jgi:hypothetical protein